MSRTGIAVAALTVAVGMAVGVELMIGSFRGAVVSWLEGSLTADVYVTQPSFVARQGNEEPLARPLAEKLLSDPAVEAAILLRRFQANCIVDSDGARTQRIRICAFGYRNADSWSLEQRSRESGFRLIDGAPQPWRRFFDEEAIFVSEPLAYRQKLRIGDSLTVMTATGPRSFPIAGILFDLASDEGFVLMARSTFVAAFADEAITGMAFFLNRSNTASHQPTDAFVEEQATRLQQQAPSWWVHPNKTLRSGTLVIFDRTFRVTDVLRALSLVVAAIGIWASFLALALERSREFAVLRARGFTSLQLGVVMVVQGTIMGAIAGLVALPLGYVVCELLIEYVHKQSFGWSIPFELGRTAPWGGFLTAVVAGGLAAVVPAWRIRRGPIADALREE